MRPHPWQWSVSVSTGNTSALVRGQFTDKANGKNKLKEIFQIVLLGIWCKTSRNRMNIETCLQNNCMYRMCSIFPCKFQTTTCLCAFANCEGFASFLKTALQLALEAGAIKLRKYNKCGKDRKGAPQQFLWSDAAEPAIFYQRICRFLSLLAVPL